MHVSPDGAPAPVLVELLGLAGKACAPGNNSPVSSPHSINVVFVIESYCASGSSVCHSLLGQS